MTIQEAFWSGVVIGSIVMAAVHALLFSATANSMRQAESRRRSSFPRPRW